MVKYDFCPKCGKSVDQKDGVVKCPNCHHAIYLHSAITGSVFVINDKKVMLSKRKFDPYKGAWDVPGGFLKFGEDPEVGAMRELYEETGVDVKITKLLGVYMDKYPFQDEVIPTLNCIFIGTIGNQTPEPADDVEEIKWFDLDKPLPKIPFPAISKALEDLARIK